MAELVIPEDTLGIHVLYPPKGSKIKPTVDIVAIHGLGGDAYKTWIDQSSGCLWLRDLLPKSDVFQDARVMTFGYNAKAFLKPFERAKNGNTFAFAEALLNDLSDKRVRPEEKSRPIIFVGHSLGGIVIKEALNHANALDHQYGDILQSTRSLMFFGTPHQGADAAVWGSYLETIGKSLGIRNTKASEDLGRWSKPLLELTRLFAGRAKRWPITTFYENDKFYGVVVVPEGSALLGIENERVVELDANHHSICKFAPGTRNYDRVLARFEAVRFGMMEGNTVLCVGTEAEVSRSTQDRESEEHLKQFEDLRARLKTIAGDKELHADLA